MVKIADDFAKFAGLGDLIQQRMRAVPNNALVWEQFKSFAQLPSNARARDVITGGISAPTLKLAELDSDTERCNGLFDAAQPDTIVLCTDIARHAQGKLADPTFAQLVESTILHELVHFGNFRAGDIDRGDPLTEWGKAFELAAYGKDVDRDWLPQGACSTCGTKSALFNAKNTVRQDLNSGVIKDMPTTPGDAPLAISTSANRAWPIQTSDPSKYLISYKGLSGTQYGPPERAFFAPRRGNDEDSIADDRHHVGVDLYGKAGEQVVACEAGEIVNIHPFYLGTMALLVLCESGIVVNYGEVADGSWGSLQIGSRVTAGMPIARVGTLSRGSMCHFETYTKDTRQTARWKWNAPRPENILNPTRYLLELPRS